MDAADFLALCLVNFACATVVGVVVDARAKQRDAALRTYVAGVNARLRDGLTSMDAMLREMRAIAEGRGVSSTPPPTLQ